MKRSRANKADQIQMVKTRVSDRYLPDQRSPCDTEDLEHLDCVDFLQAQFDWLTMVRQKAGRKKWTRFSFTDRLYAEVEEIEESPPE